MAHRGRVYVYRGPARRALVRVVDALGDALHGSPRARARAAPLPRRVRTVLAIKLDHLGDLILSLPAIHALRAGHPGARLHALVAPASVSLLEGTRAVDEFHTLAPTWLTGGRFPLGALARMASTLRALRPDVAVVLRDDPFSIALARASGAPFCAGLGGAGLGFLLARELFARPGAHQVDVHLEVALAAGGKEPASRVPSLHVTAAERERGRALVGRSERRPLAIHLGATDPRRCWTPEGFAATARALQGGRTARGRSIVLLGAAAERPLAARALAALAGLDVVDLVGRTTLRELLGVLAESALLLGANSGLGHMAAALGTPVAVAFATAENDPRSWAPRGPRVAVVDMPRVDDPAVVHGMAAAAQGLLGES